MLQTSSTLILLCLGLVSNVQGACIGPDVNAATIELIEGFEGWRPDVYTDPTGNPTVGYGHLCTEANCAEVPYSIPLSEADGEALLRSDLTTAQQCITLDTTSEVVLNANQYGALVSWAFNVGCGAAGSSTLISRLNDNEDPDTVASEELPKWNKGNGEVIDGLTRRRAAEVDLFTTSTSDAALPVGC
ncbi:lysozyme-like domain-containing protein [Thelonectria olida]|uniref:Lysozyme-like domain-containing protein n=1 Tax=Thelonectria olida TaxID=1576542 RepID=A0A9P8VST0_9HYPO|nr:lysozyme-like domain-containing protein [Thelonectria olida]